LGWDGDNFGKSVMDKDGESESVYKNRHELMVCEE